VDATHKAVGIAHFHLADEAESLGISNKSPNNLPYRRILPDRYRYRHRYLIVYVLLAARCRQLVVDVHVMRMRRFSVRYRNGVLLVQCVFVILKIVLSCYR
jgi:hypothetical protein